MATSEQDLCFLYFHSHSHVKRRKRGEEKKSNKHAVDTLDRVTCNNIENNVSRHTNSKRKKPTPSQLIHTDMFKV